MRHRQRIFLFYHLVSSTSCSEEELKRYGGNMQGYCKAISYSNYIFCRSRRCCLFIANRKTRCLSLLASFVDCPITSASPTLLKLLTSSYPCTASPVKVDGMPTGSILRKPSVTVWMFGTVMALPRTVVQKYKFSVGKSLIEIFENAR